MFHHPTSLKLILSIMTLLFCRQKTYGFSTGILSSRFSTTSTSSDPASTNVYSISTATTFPTKNIVQRVSLTLSATDDDDDDGENNEAAESFSGSTTAAAVSTPPPVDKVAETPPKPQVKCPDCDLCDGSGRILGGLGAVVPWLPVKAYRPCPNFVQRGGSYQRSGQGLDEIAFGRDSKFDINK